MNHFFRFCFLLAIIISINLAGVDAYERGEFNALKSSPVSSEQASLNIPSWAVHLPEHSFVGISSPCRSIEEARQQALDSAIGQILQSMGADYHLSHESVLSGDLHQSKYELKELLSYTAKWLLNSVPQNIKQYIFQNTGNGHICFVLIQMKPSDLDRLKRLTIGAKLTARAIDKGEDHIFIEAQETNGVGVTLTEYQISVTMTNNHSRLITLFLWKVQESDSTSLEGALTRRLFLKNGSGRTVIYVPQGNTGIKSFLMGSVQSLNITLSGYDEIGRPVSVPVRFP